MVLNVLKITNEEEAKVLQNPSIAVAFAFYNPQEIRDLCANMVETMYASNGAGLAAPQVGRNLNIFVMRTVKGMEGNFQEHIVLINPYTVIETGDKVTDREGCLSIPGMVDDVERFPTVGCVYWDVEGKRQSAVFTNLQARIYQHEKDHLDGVLYIMRAAKMYRKKNATKGLPEYDELTLRKLLGRTELKHGVYYLGRCRNATVARWNAKEGCFYHWRVKFGQVFIETIKHPEDDQTYDVFRPVRELTDPKFEIPFDDNAEFGGKKEDLYGSEMNDPTAS